MISPAERPYLADLEDWRHWPLSNRPIAPTSLDELSADLMERVGALAPEYQSLYLAWYPALAVLLKRRPELLHELLELGASGRASTIEEFQLALAFTVWTAESPEYAGTIEFRLTDEGVQAAEEALKNESGRVLMHRLENAKLDDEAESDRPLDFTDHDDRLNRLHELFAREVVPWQALDLWFVVPDDTSPLFDDDGSVTRRAPLVHTILTRLPEEFTLPDVVRWCGDPVPIAAAIAAVEGAEIVVREGLFPTCRWRKVRALEDLRGDRFAT